MNTGSPFYEHNIFTKSPKKTSHSNTLLTTISMDSAISTPKEGTSDLKVDVDNTQVRKNHIYTTITKKRKLVRNIDILLKLFRTLAGKDKLAKIIKYVIDLLKLIISDQKYNNFVYKKIISILNLFTKSIVSKSLPYTQTTKTYSQLSHKNINVVDVLTTLSTNIGIYRQLLRFGWSGFNLEKIFNRTRTLIAQGNFVDSKPLDEDDLALFIEFYYNITDELLLLRKLKVWNNEEAYKVISKHEALSWYYDIILSIKRNICTYNQIKSDILELQIKLNLKERCLKNLNLNSSLRDQLLDDIGDTKYIELKLLEQNKKLTKCKLDLFRLFWDFLADTTDVFNMKTPRGTYAILSLCSGVTGFVKLWIQNKEELESESDSE